MAKLTKHARMRLKERYNIEGITEIQTICNYLHMPSKYKIVTTEEGGREIRQIEFGKTFIHAVVNKNHILTFIPVTNICIGDDSVESHRIRINNLTKKMNNLSNKVEELEALKEDLLNRNLLQSLIFLFYYRIKNKESN